MYSRLPWKSTQHSHHFSAACSATRLSPRVRVYLYLFLFTRARCSSAVVHGVRLPIFSRELDKRTRPRHGEHHRGTGHLRPRLRLSPQEGLFPGQGFPEKDERSEFLFFRHAASPAIPRYTTWARVGVTDFYEFHLLFQRCSRRKSTFWMRLRMGFRLDGGYTGWEVYFPGDTRVYKNTCARSVFKMECI